MVAVVALERYSHRQEGYLAPRPRARKGSEARSRIEETAAPAIPPAHRIVRRFQIGRSGPLFGHRLVDLDVTISGQRPGVADVIPARYTADGGVRDFATVFAAATNHAQLIP